MVFYSFTRPRRKRRWALRTITDILSNGKNVGGSAYGKTVTSEYPATKRVSNEATITTTAINNRVVYQGNTPAVDTLETTTGFFQKGFDTLLYVLTSTLVPLYWGYAFVGGFLGMIIARDSKTALIQVKLL